MSQTRWTWADVYPRHRVVTLVLPEDEAAELLDQARIDGRMIAPDTVLGMPAIAFENIPNTPAPAIVPQKAQEGNKSCGKPDDATHKPQAADAGQAVRAPRGAGGGGNIVILPCVRRERLPEPAPAQPGDKLTKPLKPATRGPVKGLPPMGRVPIAPKDDIALAPRRSIMDERPPMMREPEETTKRPRWNPATGRLMRPGEITKADRQMVADALANGFPVTRCPPRKYSVEIGQPDAGSPTYQARTKTRCERLSSPAQTPVQEGVQ